MDAAYLIDVGSLLLRWLHLIVGIAWIGSSFYFVWLDNSLKAPTDPELIRKGVGGELWAVHGGGFYNPQKYLVAPQHLPEELHWFKWESYSTWITGFFLLGVLYYSQAATYMVDPAKAALSPAAAIGIGLATLAGGWLVYDGLCRLLINRSLLLFAALYFAFVVAVAWGLTHLLSGRAAFLHVGAMIATTMSGNVFFWIIPGQKTTVAAMQRGETPDPIHGKRAKQRSVHNNYLTLPVLFCMISNHYAFTYNHPQAWRVLAMILLAAVLIRHFFNLRHKGQVAWQYPALGAALLLAVFVELAPRHAAPAAGSPAASLADIQPIVVARCTGCHAARPTLIPAAPAGVLLDSAEAIRANGPRILAQAVQLKAMPLGNVTGMTDSERERIAAWAAGGYR
ncbi:MAG TPA: urate hydroxylase PuuD [Zoogloea sp.]|uniref:urate hydroxylase PuuD n=1 Tax=Zoogloea sp. TaxID=49181 RepID=UPI002BAFD4C3|nr:urate hydroxylase PuuD [Zoogloea sp.]HMV61774.1 urate hydroxylase PuuD [Rhodocyclaceae bacterium]HMW51709.1 urate hydroxylase PuuD [Rhodocyclaceae bacterium]HMY48397.1 urate hydroxylase PuuD [Rhodocyclaceae bacterium]HMZ75584.1 urate hydroxylase PuuD [Rhodocyclaceae bacterium]HNA66248.1 urate hydroxylase PuuD [Rhodocyclaceae bacterium]